LVKLFILWNELWGPF